MRADPAERPQEASLSDREERILALEDLHAMRILQDDELAAEMKRLTEPQPKLDPTSPEPPAHRQRGRRHTRAEPRWVVELLALVERWLESAPLPRASLLYGGRSYLIRSSTHLRQTIISAGEMLRAGSDE